MYYLQFLYYDKFIIHAMINMGPETSVSISESFEFRYIRIETLSKTLIYFQNPEIYPISRNHIDHHISSINVNFPYFFYCRG